MATTTTSETITADILAMKKKMAQMETQRKDLLSAEKKEKAKQARKAEDNKKYLVGAYYLDLAAKNPDYQAKLNRAMDGYLAKATDRAQFGLAEREIGLEKGKVEQVQSTQATGAVRQFVTV